MLIPEQEQLQEVEASIRKTVKLKERSSNTIYDGVTDLNSDPMKVDQQLSQFKLVQEPSLEKSKSQLEQIGSDNQANPAESNISIESEKKSLTNDSADLRSQDPRSVKAECEGTPRQGANSKGENLSGVYSSRRFIKMKKSISKSEGSTEIFGAFCATNLPNTLCN